MQNGLFIVTYPHKLVPMGAALGYVSVIQIASLDILWFTIFTRLKTITITIFLLLSIPLLIIPIFV